MNALILGNGRSGRAAAELLRYDGWCVRVLDGDESWPDGIWDLCVTSPGIPLDHRWQVSARNAGIHVISELQLGAERFRKIGGRMLAVTGSKGKSSVVKLVADAIGGIPCGNYGKPLCEVALESMGTDPKKKEGSKGSDPLKMKKIPIAVVEVSSFQMETTDLPSDTFDAAAILNLQEDHLDRHGSVEIYHALKRKLLDCAAVKIVGTDPSEMGTDPEKSEKKDRDIGLFAGSYFDNLILRDNGLCAVALMRACGLGDDAIRKAFLCFTALPHRMQIVGEFDGVAWIDDSKATSISALIAGTTMAISRYRVRLIAGGLAKGDNPMLAADCLSKGVAKVYLIGRCADVFENAWKDVVPCEMCGTLETAVERARSESQKGDCVLLSPGTASFDQFKSYGERGDRFAALSRSC